MKTSSIKFSDGVLHMRWDKGKQIRYYRLDLLAPVKRLYHKVRSYLVLSKVHKYVERKRKEQVA